ncbi:MAG: heat-inducible transcriptional repressor HrcA, partial [Gammaproteobacteria bacterium]|nr:heat-inducible transcriptional repressor HrcA [Gammaproteobacteria bacterium]
VENRVIQTTREFSANELLHMSNYLNAEFMGKNIHRVRADLLTQLRNAREDVNEFMASLIDMADTLFTEDAEGDLLVTGKTNLLAYQEIGDTEKLRRLFEVFKGKKDMLEVLDQCLSADGMQMYIGSESGNNLLDQCSIITSPYTRDGEVVGVMGVIGPTRMNYEKVIPIVDITAKLFSSALEFK